MPTVRANAAAVVRVGGVPIGIREGQSFDTKDPIVREYPWLFGDREVEQATASPGERRAATRRKA